MKLRYLYLAIGVLCNASLVSCGDSFKEKTEIVACGISTNALTFGVSSTEVQTVDITSEAAWEVAVDQAGGNWLTVSPLEGTGNGTLTAELILKTLAEKRRNRRDKTYKQIPFYNVEERSAQYVERLKEKYLFT